MSSSHHKNKDCYFFRTKESHFFKIIHEDYLQDKKLLIPRMFVRRYGNRLSEHALLRVPSGKKWRVEIKKYAGGEAWFEKGWQEFAAYHSLEHGYILDFEYVVDSLFFVVILDKTGVEIEYPINSTGDRGPNQDRLKESAVGCCKEDSLCMAYQGIENANKFASMSKYPSFTVAAKLYHIQAVPFPFVRKYIMDAKCYRITTIHKLKLRAARDHVVGDKLWPVTLTSYSSNNTARLYAGWRAFFQENSLKVGDACVFELIKKDLLDVTIFSSKSWSSPKMAPSGQAPSGQANKEHYFVWPKKPHFFKVILRETLKEKKLMIPEAFVRDYPNGLLSDLVQLKVPTGKVWQIGLVKCGDDEIWLQNGWEEFVDYYSLEEGYFLMFKYEGSSQLSVVIFDHSALGIDYPVYIPCKPDGDLMKPKKEETDDISFDLEAEFYPKEKGGKPPQPHSGNKRRTCSIKDAARTESKLPSVVPASHCQVNQKKTRNSQINTHLGPSVSKSAGEAGTSVGKRDKQACVMGSRSRSLLGEETAKAFQRAEDNIVIEILDDFSPKSRKRGKSPIKHSNSHKRARYDLTHSDHSLSSMKKADRKVALLHSSTHKEKVMQGVKKRSAGGQAASSQTLISSRTLDLASQFRSKYPSFKRIMQRSQIAHGSEFVPIKFYRRYMQSADEEVTLQVGDKFWPVKLLFYSHIYVATIRAGWKTFARENSLNMGDICVFELIKKNVFNVVIFRTGSMASDVTNSKVEC